MHASASFIIQITTSIHHTSMDMEFKTCAMQANICKCTYKYNIQVYELAPPTCVLQILIDPLTMSFHLFAPPISYYLCEFSPPLSTISTKGELKF